MNSAFVAVYLLAMIGIGVYNARRARTRETFLVAGRQSGVVLVAGSLVATILAGSTTIGLAGMAFTKGLVAAWWLLAGVVGLIFLALFFAERIRASGEYTLTGLLAAQYGPAVRRPAAVVIAVGWVGIIAAQVVAAGKVLAAATGGSAPVWMAVATAVFLTYTLLGGQLSVLQTDLWQAVLILAGLAALLAAAWGRAGGFAALAQLPPGATRFPVNAELPAWPLVSMVVAVGLPYTIGPDLASRLFCARDERTARRAVWLSAAVLAPTAFAIATMGLLARVLLPDIEPGQALPALVGLCLPGWLGALAYAAILAALISTGGTCLLTSATILAVDVLGWREEHEVLRGTRTAAASIALIALAAAWSKPDIIQSLLWAYMAYTCGLGVPLVAGFFRERLGLTARGALAAMAAGGGLGLAGKLCGRDLALPALALAAAFLWLGSRCGRRER
ncbi:MAG: sodium:solute symporter family protein [Armatimonadetes bacterium]|nr:sodium:solute symporter family protein [Armatimonadota bacterium]